MQIQEASETTGTEDNAPFMTEPTGDSQENIQINDGNNMIDDSFQLNEINQINLDKEHLNIKKKLDGSYFCPYT